MDSLQQPRRSERLRLLRIASNSSGREELHVVDSSTMTRSMQSGLPDTSTTVGVSAECPICFGVFVKTVAIYPCGHNFCQQCFDEHLTCIAESNCSNCSICRGQIRGFVPNKLVDSFIWSMALNGGFSKDDAVCYLNRLRLLTGFTPSEEEIHSILGCGVGETSTIMNQDGA